MSTQIKISELPQISNLTNDIIWPASTNVSGEFTSGVISIEQIRNNILGESFEQNNLSDTGISSFSGRIGTLETKVYYLESIDYATKEDIPEVPSLDGYALKSEIPSTAGFTTVNSNNNLVKDSSTVTQLTIGSGLISPNNNCLTTGKFNNAQSSWDAMLWIGSGSSSSARKNQMIVQEDQIHYRGELKEASGWIGDFGEYFEWNDGNPNNEDRVGYMVQLNEDKIELAESIENCIGIISDTCIITGGGCSFEWHNMYLRDDFGRELKDENGNSIVNPEYNPDVEYISRDKRQEWDKVGILGQIHTRQDGTLKVGGFAGCENGIATNAETGYRVLRIINENVALLLVK